jgi:hypothetical protein
MVLCPPRPAEPSGTGLNPDPGLDSRRADPFPDLQPGPDGPSPPGSARLTRPPCTRKRLVIATAIPAALALAVIVPPSWWPGVPSRLPFIHVTRPIEPRAAITPKLVIHQARARQRHRRRRIMRDITIGAGAALAGRSSGSPPRHRRRSHTGHPGQPPPVPGAETLPGLAALDHGQAAHISGLSCPSAGNCAIIGAYGNHGEGFLDSEINGRWHKAEQIPGLAGRDPDDTARLACPSTGTCLIAGSYRAGPGRWASYQVTEHDGIWGNAHPIPGLPDGDSPFVLSCSSAGNCAVSGTRMYGAGDLAFVDSESNGKWGKAQLVPGQARLSRHPILSVTAISCTSPGDCAIAGTYDQRMAGGFVASETDGAWGAAQQILGTAASFIFSVTAISCASAGNCALTGTYNSPDGKTGPWIPFVASQINGTWHNAEPVPGFAALDPTEGGQPMALSCPVPGQCTAVGDYGNSHNPRLAFAVTQTGGTWGTAEEVPGTAARHGHGVADFETLSCSSAGNCSAGGQFGSAAHTQAFTITQTGGTWHTARHVPGIKTLTPTAQQSIVLYTSCPPAGPCGAAGQYGDAFDAPFVVG